MGNGRSKVAARRLHDFHTGYGGNEDASGMSRSYAEPLLQNEFQPIDARELQKERNLQIADAGNTRSADEIPLSAIIHQLNSFYAVMWPVATTMVITSLAVCSISDPQTTHSMRAYMYYKDIDTSPTLSTAQKSVEALCNAMIVIAFIALLTFGIVLLYKFNGMKLFLGYCVFYSAALLGVVGAKLVVLALGGVFIIDQFALAFVMYNFAVVGVLGIFYQKGIPSSVERAYLISSSVIVAWQLAQLPQWSVWMLLVMLAFWDLFAVLTPMGPLRWLVDLVQEKGTPIPGLLFQADVTDAHHLKAAHTAPGRSEAELAATKTIQQSHAKLSSMPEHLFFQRLLTAGLTSSNSGTSKTLETLGHQLHMFLRDQHSQFERSAGDLSRAFAGDPNRLWRNLYAYYLVCHVPPSQPYPPVTSVFPPEFTTSASALEDDEETVEQGELDDKSIKLGLGDFIFYSVLVARAALQSFTAFAACFVSVLVGLAATLYLLARVDALPALPISIFLSVSVFLLTAGAGAPMIDALASSGILL